MTYRTFMPWQNEGRRRDAESTPDDRSGSVYLQDPRLQLAVETAIVTQRPLLLRGEPGSGKSSFAPFAARNLNWRYYELTVTGRTEAKALLWSFDALARLRDAYAQEKDLSPARYVTPGVLWWAFNRKNALAFCSAMAPAASVGAGVVMDEQGRHPLAEPFGKLNAERDPLRAVVLIDEIDKADPDVPNDLLEAFGSNRFVVEEARHLVERDRPKSDEAPTSPGHFGSLLVVVTTNNERELPAAFVRRCIVHRLEEPRQEAAQVERWQNIADLHARDLIAGSASGAALVQAVAQKCWQLREQALRLRRRAPSTAEFLDALYVCIQLGIEPGSELWKHVESNVLVKGDAPNEDISQESR